jgi:hypothetical protein
VCQVLGEAEGRSREGAQVYVREEAGHVQGVGGQVRPGQQVQVTTSSAIYRWHYIKLQVYDNITFAIYSLGTVIQVQVSTTPAISR